jgi:vacuolar-type H+-ATPase subunit F/Vma7
MFAFRAIVRSQYRLPRVTATQFRMFSAENMQKVQLEEQEIPEVEQAVDAVEQPVEEIVAIAEDLSEMEADETKHHVMSVYDKLASVTK